MNKECRAKLAVSRRSVGGSTVGNFIVCSGADSCPFEAKLNDVPVTLTSLYREENLSQSSWQAATEIQHMGAITCAQGYSRINTTENGKWEIHPGKGDRLFNQVLHRLLPPSKSE